MDKFVPKSLTRSTFLFKEGERAKKIYIVTEGELIITKQVICHP